MRPDAFHFIWCRVAAVVIVRARLRDRGAVVQEAHDRGSAPALSKLVAVRGVIGRLAYLTIAKVEASEHTETSRRESLFSVLTSTNVHV